MTNATVSLSSGKIDQCMKFFRKTKLKPSMSSKIKEIVHEVVRKVSPSQLLRFDEKLTLQKATRWNSKQLFRLKMRELRKGEVLYQFVDVSQ